VTATGCAIFDGRRWQEYTLPPPRGGGFAGDLQPANAGTVLCSLTLGDKLVIGARKGLFLREQKGMQWRQIYPHDEKYSWAPTNVKVVQLDARQRLWFGADQGVGYLAGQAWHLFTGRDGLPYNRFTCSAAGKDGSVWFGTDKGAIRTDGLYFWYRFSRRWLADDHVNAITVADDGTIWIATDTGVSRIVFQTMTLRDKAEYFISQVETRHNRMGFIAQCHLKERYNVASWQHAISDNDGLYTAMYGAAQAFRYAVTGEPEARRLATRSLEACEWLVDITHEPGFPARVIIPVDWHEPVNDIYGYDYNVRRQRDDPFWKHILPRFVRSEDGRYLWKCDTSSDELAGHYFFYGIYHDLVAETAAEKASVREVVAALTDHLIRNGFLLRDHDGKPTRWGNFSPEFLDSIWGWEQRGLNAMMMLSFLNVAEHVTGDRRYAETAQMLREKHLYHINAMQAKIYFPPENVVPWDNNLCLMSMYGLLNYEKDAELLLMYRLSLEHAWQHISRQKNAFWNVIYGALLNRFRHFAASGIYQSGRVFIQAGPYAERMAKQLTDGDPRVPDIVESLQRLPLDLIGYDIDNTHRLDIVFDPTPGQEADVGWRVDGGALPVDERGHVRQDRDGFALHANEDGGRAEHEGTFYLLPYYMALYHGLLD
jgi:hypothetical protein